MCNADSLGPTIRRGKIDLRRLSMKVVLPALLIGPTLLNQEESEILLRIIGQVVMMGGTLAVIIILLTTLGPNKWSLFCVLCFLFSKAGLIAFGEGSIYYQLYVGSMAFLFAHAGAVILFREPRMIYKQIMFFCRLSLPLMILQILGVGSWTQSLRSDLHNYFDITKEQTVTLFAESTDVIVTTLQARPAGFCYANNVFSVLLVFAIGLHYGLTKNNRLTLNDTILCAVSVVAMSKLVFLAFAVTVLWFLLFGSGRERRRMTKVMLLFVCLMVAYRFLFPGLYSYNLGTDSLKKNFFARVAWMAKSIENDKVRETIKEAFEENYYFRSHFQYEAAGYSGTMRSLKYLIALISFVLPLYYIGLLKLKRRHPDRIGTALLVFFLFLIVIFGFGSLSGGLLWFIGGFGLLPVLLVLEGGFTGFGRKRTVVIEI